MHTHIELKDRHHKTESMNFLTKYKKEEGHSFILLTANILFTTGVPQFAAMNSSK